MFLFEIFFSHIVPFWSTKNRKMLGFFAGKILIYEHISSFGNNPHHLL